jgi:hypothetical protein
LLYFFRVIPSTVLKYVDIFGVEYGWGESGWISLYKFYSSMLANYQRTDTKMKVVGTLQAAGDSFMAYKMGKGKNSKLLQELKEKYNN